MVGKEMMPNKAIRVGRRKKRGASQLRRVCRAWHLTSQVKVLIPGIRRAEG